MNQEFLFSFRAPIQGGLNRIQPMHLLLLCLKQFIDLGGGGHVALEFVQNSRVRGDIDGSVAVDVTRQQVWILGEDRPQAQAVPVLGAEVRRRRRKEAQD